MPSWLEVALRTLFAVVVLFLLTKLLGKRQISQLSLFEYITGITLGSLAGYVSLDLEAEWYLGLVSLSVWVLVSYGTEFLQIKSKKARDLIDGKATVLIKDGKILENNLKKERLTSDELLEQLRKKNIFKAADVEFAIIEPSGEINVLLQKEHQPLTPAHLGIKVSQEHEPQAVIMDGKMMMEPLGSMGLTQEWVHKELKKLGVSLEDVFMGQVDSNRQLFVDLFDDQVKLPKNPKKASLLTQLKKCEADLEIVGLSAANEESKQMYKEVSNELQKVIANVRSLLAQ